MSKDVRTPRVFTITLAPHSVHPEDADAAQTAVAAFDMSVTGTYAKRHLYVTHDQAIALTEWVLDTLQNRTLEFEYNLRRGQYVARDDINFAVWRGLDDQALTLEQWSSITNAESYVQPLKTAVGGYLYDIDTLSEIIREYGYRLASEEGVHPTPVIERTPNTVTIDGQTYARVAADEDDDR